MKHTPSPAEMENPNNSIEDPGNYTISWFDNDFGGYPMIYPINIYHLYAVVQCARVIHILWYVIGCFGNVLSMKIWTNPRMKRVNSSALYLVCITLCDITYQILHVFAYLKYFWGLPSLGFPWLCQIWNVLNMIPQYASQLLVLGFTIERFISILCPFKSERFSKRDRAPREVTVIMILVIATCLPQAYFWEVDPRGFCELKPDENVGNLYAIWSFVTETAIFLVVPVVTLFLNIFVLRETRKSLKLNETLHTNHNLDSRVHRKGRTSRPATITLLCISFFRILTQLPVSITYTMQNMEEFGFGALMPLADMRHDSHWRTFLTYWGARIIIEAIGASHHALSFFIFYFSTKQFRIEVTKLVSKMKAVISGKSEDQSPGHEYHSGVRYSLTCSHNTTVASSFEVTRM